MNWSTSGCRTSAGYKVGAGAVAVTTNVPFVDQFPIHTKQAPYHTYVIGAGRRPGTLTLALFWDLAIHIITCDSNG